MNIVKNKIFFRNVAVTLAVFFVGTSAGAPSRDSGYGQASFLNLGISVSAMFGGRRQINIPAPWEIDDVWETMQKEIKSSIMDAAPTAVLNAAISSYISNPNRNLNIDETWIRLLGQVNNRDIRSLFETNISSLKNENTWDALVFVQPSKLRIALDQNINISIDTSTPRSKALMVYYKHCRKQNPRISMGALMRNETFKDYANKFGRFPDNRIMSNVLGQITGSDTGHVEGWDVLRDMIKEEGWKSIGLGIQEMVEPAMEHPKLAGAAIGTMFFKPMSNVIRSSVLLVSNTCRKLCKKLFFNKLKIESDPEKMLDNLNNGLSKSIIGQDEAIRSLSVSVAGWLNARRAPQMSRSIGALLICFLGGSGIGKTLTARVLSTIVFGRDMQSWQFITASAIRSDDERIPADQIFNDESELIRQLTLNPEVIIVLDEVDKMAVNDPKGTILERLRDAKDTGKLCIRTRDGNYKFIDISRTIFIVTSNEFTQCWGLEPENLSAADSKARTTVQRDQSLTNRFKVIVFKSLTEPTYLILLKPYIDEFISICSKKYGTKIILEEDFNEKVSHKCVVLNKGARGANDSIIDLNGRFIEYKKKVHNLPKKLLLTFDDEDKVGFDFNFEAMK